MSTPLPQTTSIDTCVSSYAQMKLKWDLPRTLLGGTTLMRAAGERYLPKDEKESDAAYKARLLRSFLFNGYAKTVNTMTGKVFSKPIVLKDDVPQTTKDIWEDLDTNGRIGDLFWEEVFAKALSYGHCHVLTDMPSMPEGATLADEQAAQIRPYCVKVDPEQLIGWTSEKRGSKQVLTSVRIYEATFESDGDFGEEFVERIRYITETEWQLWKLAMDPKTKKSQWIMEASGPMTLGYIPLRTFYTKRTGFMTSEPPLEDLAWINVAHWQSSSDQRHILHVARVPLLFGQGLGEDADSIIVGPNRLINGPENSDLKYVEHSGKAIESGRLDIQDLEDQMKIMGLELLLPSTRGGGQTATAKSLDYADINSPLQFMARGMADVIEQTFMDIAAWQKQPTDNAGSVKVNTDFGITLRDAADVQALIQSRLAGEISSETFWGELKRRNILSEDFDAVAEAKLITQEEAADAKKALEAAQNLAKASGKVPGAAPGTPPGVGSDVPAAQ